MHIYIDTADIDEIKEAFSWGIVDGVTTNPSLIKKAAAKNADQKSDLKDYIKQILETAGEDCPVSLEVISTTESEMLQEAHSLFETFNPVAENVVIKVPINPKLPDQDLDPYAGLKVLTQLDEENIPTNCTLVMTPEQALLAAKAGADYISPFAGRIDDDLRKRAGLSFNKSDYFPAEGLMPEDRDEPLHDNGIVSGVHLVLAIVEIFNLYDLGSEIIAASVRNAQQVRELAETGADIATVPFPVIQSMISHPKTEEGMANFCKDVVPEYRDLFRG
jgi:transaldolase